MITNIKEALKYLDILDINATEFFGPAPLSIKSLTEEQEKWVKKQYHKLALKYHPDRTHDNSSEAREKIQNIINAKDELLEKFVPLTWFPKPEKVQESIRVKELKENCISIIHNLSLPTLNDDFLIFKQYLSELEVESGFENTAFFLRETFHVLQEDDELLNGFLDVLLVTPEVEHFSFLLIIPDIAQIGRILPGFSNDQRIDLIKKMMPEMELYYFNYSLNQLLKYIHRMSHSANVNSTEFSFTKEFERITKAIKLSKLYNKEQYEDALKLILHRSDFEEKDLIKLAYANEENPAHLRIIFNNLKEEQRASLMSGLLNSKEELSLNILYAVAPYPEHLEKGLARSSQGTSFDLINMIYPELYLFQSRPPIEKLDLLFPEEDVTSELNVLVNNIFSSIHTNERYNVINYFESYYLLIKSLSENESKNFLKESLARPFLKSIVTPEGIRMPLLIKTYLNIYRNKLKRIDELNMSSNSIWDANKYHTILNEVEQYHQNGKMMTNDLIIFFLFIKKVTDVDDFFNFLQGIAELKAESLLAKRISLLQGNNKWDKSLLVLLVNYRFLLKITNLIPANTLFDSICNMKLYHLLSLKVNELMDLKEIARLKLEDMKKHFLQLNVQTLEIHKKVDGELAETILMNKIKTINRKINASASLEILLSIFKEIHELDITYQTFKVRIDILKELPINDRLDFVADKDINNKRLLNMAGEFPDILNLIFSLLPEESKFDLINEHLADLSDHKLSIYLLKDIFHEKIKQVRALGAEKYLDELDSEMNVTQHFSSIKQLYSTFQRRMNPLVIDRAYILQLKSADIFIELNKINEETPHWTKNPLFIRTLLSRLEFKDKTDVIQLALKTHQGNHHILSFFKENTDDMHDLITLASDKFQFICSFHILFQNNQMVPLMQTILLKKISEISSALVLQKGKQVAQSHQLFKSPEADLEKLKTKVERSSQATALGLFAKHINQFIKKYKLNDEDEKAEMNLKPGI